MRRTGFLGLLFLTLVAVVAGLIGYQAGLASNAAAAGATVVVTGGFPGLGTLFFLLFLGFVFFSFAGMRRRAWSSGHRNGPWAGRMAGTDPDDPRHQWVADMHRRLHEETDPRPAGTDPAA